MSQTIDKFFGKKRTQPDNTESPGKTSSKKMQKVDSDKGVKVESTEEKGKVKTQKKDTATVPGTTYGTALYSDMAAWKKANPG